MVKLTFFKLLACCFLITEAHAQIYVDPTVAAATAAHAGIINSQLNKTNDNLIAIQRAQLAVTGQLVIVNDLQNKLYQGLSEVAGAIRSLLAVKDIADISADIVTDAGKAVQYAADNPAYLLFAEAGAREFKARATQLATDVGAFVLQGGGQNLMDAGERAKLLNHIREELMVIRGVAFGMQRSMFWAKQRGFFNALNPYAGFVDVDKQIADDIINNSKLLKE